MPKFECVVHTSAIIEADDKDDARLQMIDLIMSEPDHGLKVYEADEDDEDEDD